MNRAEVEGIIKETTEENGHLDCMFNNERIGVRGNERGKKFDGWERIININFMACSTGQLQHTD